MSTPTPIAGGRSFQALRFCLPVLTLAAGVLAWDLIVRLNHLPPYTLPGPWLVLTTLVQDWGILSRSLLSTLVTTLCSGRRSAASRWAASATGSGAPGRWE